MWRVWYGWVIALTIAFMIGGDRAQGAQESDVRELARQLRTGDRDARREAARQLSEWGAKAKAALPELIKGIQDRDPQIWEFSILAIDRMGPLAADAIPVLIRQLNGAPQQRYRTSVALGHIGPAALPELIQALGGSAASRRGAADALAVMGPAAAPALKALGTLLADNDAEVRAAAAKALAAIGPKSLPVVETALKGSNSSARAAALTVLEQLKDQARPLSSAIEAACGDSHFEVRTAALRALVQVTGVTKSNAELFIEGLRDDEPSVRKAALDAMAAAQQADYLIPLLIELARTETGMTQRYAVYLLGRHGRGRSDVVSALTKLAAAPDEELRREVVRSFVRMGRPAVGEILKQLGQSPEAAPALASALAGIGGAARQALLTAIQADDPNTRASAARALGQLPLSSESRAALVRAAIDPDSAVRVAAISALLEHHDELGDEELDAIERRLQDDAPAVRAAAAGILAASNAVSQDRLTQVRQLLADSSGEVRAATLAVVKSWEPVPAELVPVLVAQFGQADDETLAALLELAASSEALRAAARRQLAAALPGAAKSARSRLRQSAALVAAALADKDPNAVHILTRLIRDEDQSVAIAALTALQGRQFRSEELRKSVLAAARSGADGVRVAAIRCLPSVAPDADQRMPLLLELLADGSWTIRAEACRGLGALGADAKEAVPELLRLLDSRDDEEAARAALQQIGAAGPEAVPLLKEMLRSRSPRRKMYAVYLLGRVEPAPVDVLGELRKLQSQGDERFQRLVRSTIERIEQAAKR